MKDMQVTMEMIRNCKSKAVAMKKKLETKRSLDNELEAKNKKLKTELHQQKRMIRTLQLGLKEQRKQLQLMTKASEDVVDEDESEDDYDNVVDEKDDEEYSD